jgi:uncharacterized protein (TIGR03437 family)
MFRANSRNQCLWGARRIFVRCRSGLFAAFGAFLRESPHPQATCGVCRRLNINMSQKYAAALSRPPIRGVILLVWLLGAVGPLSLKGATTVSYPLEVGAGPHGVVFDGTNIWTADYLTNSVTKLLASTGATIGNYSVGTGPQGIAFDGTNIWVANNGGGTVTKVLASTGATVGSYTVGANPYDVLFDGANIWVTNNGSSNVTELLASSGATEGTYSVGSAPEGLAFDGTNIWVANNGSNNVTELLAATGATVNTYPAGSGPHDMAFDGTNVWVTNTGSGTVTKLQASTGNVVGTYTAGTDPVGIVFDGTYIWVANYLGNNATQLLASSGATMVTYAAGTNPWDLAYDGVSIWATDYGTNTVTKITPSPSITPSGVVPIYSTATTIQPGEWVSIYGSNLAGGTTIWNGTFPTTLGGTSVTIDGKAAYLYFVSPGQIDLQSPSDTTTGPVSVVVTTAGGSASSTVTLGQFGPSFSRLDTKHVAGIILRLNGTGAHGGGSYDILGPTGSSLGYPTVAAKAGDIVELYGVGFGPTNPSVPAGEVPPAGPTPVTTFGVQLSIGGTAVVPSFSGLTEAGLYQINLTIPAGLGTGDLSLVGTVDGVQTPSGVVISLQ